MESVMETTTRTADLTTCKLHMNGVVSTPSARFTGGDLKDFYLNTPLKKKRYGEVRAKYIPEETIRKHKLEQYIEDDSEIWQIISQNVLRQLTIVTSGRFMCKCKIHHGSYGR